MFLQIVPEKLLVSSGMGWLKQNKEEEGNAKKVEAQQWWAISSLGRKFKGKNPDENVGEGKNPDDENGKGEKAEKAEVEVILLSNRQPKVEQLGETEVRGFIFQLGTNQLHLFWIVVSGDIFYCKVVTVRRRWWWCFDWCSTRIRGKGEKGSSQDHKKAQS